MSAIITHLDHRNDLTTHTLEGPITAEDIIATIEAYYSGEPTHYIVWDFSEVTLNQCKEENLKSIAVAANKCAKQRDGGKTALVLPSDLQFGLGRMYETFAELENAPIPVRSFRSMPEAMAWLGIQKS